MKNTPPSVNPSNENTLIGTLSHFFNKSMQKVDSCIPARIVSYDRSTNRASVKPQIAILSTDGNVISKPQIASVPVFVMGGGGFILSFPLNPGDLGWLIANDRDISIFLGNYSEQKPNTERMHAFEDAFFIPDPMTGYTIQNEDLESVSLQNMDGSIKISLSSNTITVKAPTINLIGNINITGNQTISGESVVQGRIASNQNITATGTITPGTPP